MTLFDMFNKAAGLTEDAKKYNTGDISEKTGLQKQPDGSWKPPKAKGSQPKGTEKKAKDMTYKEAAPKLNEKQKELISNMAKQNGKSVEEVFETFKDIIGFGEYDPKLAEELDRNTRFEQEKLAKKRQKKEEELRQQRQEGEAAARAFKEKVEKGEIVYNEKTGQFEDAPQKSKPLSREKATYGSASRLFETKLPPKVSFHSKDRQTEILNNIAKRKSQSGKVSEKTNDSAPLTADTKIKLSQIKTTDDAKRYNIGDISEKPGLQKTANGWVRPKKQKTSGTEQKQEKNKNSSGKQAKSKSETRKNSGAKLKEGANVYIFNDIQDMSDEDKVFKALSIELDEKFGDRDGDPQNVQAWAERWVENAENEGGIGFKKSHYSKEMDLTISGDDVAEIVEKNKNRWNKIIKNAVNFYSGKDSSTDFDKANKP